jgi:hypothetical protein
MILRLYIIRDKVVRYDVAELRSVHPFGSLPEHITHSDTVR